MAKSKSNQSKPKDSDFYQQRLRAWQPILTPKWVVITFSIIGVVFLPLGALLYITSDNVFERRIQYDGEGAAMTDCKLSDSNPTQTCTIPVKIEEDLEPPIYVYYELHNFYQNHRRYVKSRSDEQLEGKFLPASELSDCDPLIYDSQGPNRRILQPCGLIANSYFNDVITLTNNGIAMDETGIAWESDKEKFKNPPWTPEKMLEYKPIEETYPSLNRTGLAKTGVENEHFIVWMRTAALPNFRKLYGRIDTPLAADTQLTFDVDARFRVDKFEGKKFLVVSTTSWLGGKNNFLGIAYIVVGSLCFALALFFLLKMQLCGRPLGDTRFLVWKRNRRPCCS